MTKHMTGTRKDWLAARLELLKAEKELTRRSDELARRRQELPWSGRHLGHVPVARPSAEGTQRNGAVVPPP
jgi:hypothetical protein